MDAGGVMNGWTGTPEAVGQSQWRFVTHRLPADDLVALGADLAPATIIDAYRRGLFPMKVSDLPGALGWWSPDPRGILPLDGLRVTRSMRQSAKRYDIRWNTCFEAVMRGCADPAREGGWITDAFIRAYVELHRMGWTHSVETFDREGRLVGGLYGVRVGRLFAGESMFSVARDASKVALMALVERMRADGLQLLDVQWCTDHLASLGAIAIPREEYLERLAGALA